MSGKKIIDKKRRTSLKFMAGTALAVPMLMTSKSNANNRNSSFDVIVVGAGAAGLYATRQLLQQGYRVRLLEASDRHGGRIYTRTLGNTRIEMGAEEHYLARNNPVYNAVTDRFGTAVYTNGYVGEEMIVMDGNRACWAETGNCEDDKDIRNFWKYQSRYGNRKTHRDFSKTMADVVYDRYGVNQDHRAYHLYEHGIANAIFATSLDRIGAASLAHQEWEWTLSGGIRMVAPADLGYSEMLDEVWWNEVLEHIDYQRPVVEIDYSGDYVIVTDAAGDKSFAHKVIITASIGVLQSETIRFNPALPESTVEAYQNIGMGHGMKVALRFRQPFWESRLAYLVTDGPVSTAWIPSHYKQGGDDHIMMCYPMGDDAQLLTNTARRAGGGAAGDNIIVRALLQDLDNVFAGKASSAFIDAQVQDWSAEQYIRGSYSYPMLETYRSAAENMRRQLGQPVADRLYFSGEATNPQNPSCVPGALQEGRRAANLIDRQLKAVSNPPEVTS